MTIETNATLIADIVAAMKMAGAPEKALRVKQIHLQFVRMSKFNPSSIRARLQRSCRTHPLWDGKSDVFTWNHKPGAQSRWTLKTEAAAQENRLAA